MLTDFFRINMPYGMSRNADGEWMFFNREYLPLGWVSNPFGVDDDAKQRLLASLPIYSQYNGLTVPKLKKLAHHEEHGIKCNDAGDVIQVFFYNDGSNPESYPSKWPAYLERLKTLSKCQVKSI